MNRFVVGVVTGIMALSLAACGGKVDEELLPTRVPTLAPDAFAVTPLPTPSATPVPVAAAETNATAELTAPTIITEIATLTGTGELTGAGAAHTAPQAATTITATDAVTATEVESGSAEAAITGSSSLTTSAAVAPGETLTSAQTVTETESISAGEEISAAASLLPTPTSVPTTAPEATVEPTAAPTATTEPTVEPTVEPTAAPAAAAPAGDSATAVTELPAAVEAALANANATRGQSLTLSNACIGCHATDPKQMMVGPTWHNVGETAATRVEGESAEVYLYNSIVHPNAYLVPGYLAGIMIQTYGQTLSDQDMADLIAYLLSLKGQN